MNNTFLIAIAVTSTLVLTGCGNKLDKKTAKKVLLEAQEPVVHIKYVNAEIYNEGSDDEMEILNIYKKAKLIKGFTSIEGRKGWRTIDLDQKKVDKKFSDFVVVKPKSSSRMKHHIVTNYTTRVGEILRIDTKPVDRLCDALVEYKYEAFDFAPWGKDIAAFKGAGATVYEACFIKYDKDWGVKDWRKKPGRKRR